MLSASQLAKATSHFLSLVNRYNDLTLRFLNFGDEEVISTDPINQDKIRAFTLFMHAEIENYLEIIVKEILNDCKKIWETTGHLNPILLNVLIYNQLSYCGNANQGEPSKRVDTILTHSLSLIGSNHGIKEVNLLKLFQQFGINILCDHAELISELNSYGTIRGQIAHSNNFSITRNLIKKIELKRMESIFDKLFILDCETSSLLPIFFYQIKIP